MIALLWSVFSRVAPILLIGVSVSYGVAEWKLHTANKTIAADKTEISTLHSDLTTCHDSSARLQNAIRDQNAAVDALQRDANAAAERGEREIAAAQPEIDGLLRRAARIEATPATSKDLCVAAHERIRNVLSEERK